MLDFVHLLEITVDNIIRILLEKVINRLIGPIAIILVVGEFDWGADFIYSFGGVAGGRVVAFQEGFDSVGYQIGRVENIEKVLSSRQFAFNKVFFIVNGNKESEG